TRIAQEHGELAALDYKLAVGDLGKTVATARGELDAYGKAIKKVETPRPLKITVDTSQAVQALEDFRKTVTDPAGFRIDLSRPRVPIAGTDDIMTEQTITKEI